MRRVTVAVILTWLLVGTSTQAAAQGRFDPRREPRFMIDATLSYTFMTGDVGDSIDAGPGVEVAGLYQLADIPVRFGAGAGYSRHGLQDEDGSADRYDVFALAELLLFSEDTHMVPYVQGRAGWMRLSYDPGGTSMRVDGLELGALAGVDIPVAEKLSIDVAGQFSWFTGGDLSVDGTSIPGSARSGSIFAIRAGAFFFF